MRTIEATPTFKEDLKRVCQDPGRKRTVEDLLSILARDLEFMVGMPAHTLPGKWSSSTIEATRRESGEKLFVEKFIIDPRETDLSRTGIMNGYEVFGNVILMTTKEKTMQVREAVEAGVDREARLAYGASLLPGECGLIFKVLGMTSESVRGKIREFWQIARKAVAGRDLPQAFLWQ